MSNREPATEKILQHAQFFGHRRNQRDVAGFAIASMRADPTLEVERHTHETAHLILLLSGQYVTTAHGADPVCIEPAVIYNPPGTTHRDRFCRVGGRVNGSFVSIAIDSARLRHIADHMSPFEYAVHTNRVSAVRLGTRLVREMLHWSDSSPLVAEAICLELAAQAASETNEERTQARPAWLRVAYDLLHDHCVEGTSIAEIARACDVHPVYLARKFRRFFGCSPGEYLRRCRVARAAAMITDTATPLSTLALQCGYADQSHLNSAFRSAYGATPAEYRRRGTA